MATSKEYLNFTLEQLSGLGAEKEYEDDPSNDYYREGYNLYLRLVKYKESELKFLHDKKVPADNSLAERLVRQYKRKQKQAIVFRSDEGFSCICDSISVIRTFRKQEEKNFYDKAAEIFSRSKAKKKPDVPVVWEKAGFMLLKQDRLY